MKDMKGVFFFIKKNYYFFYREQLEIQCGLTKKLKKKELIEKIKSKMINMNMN
jgi:hypothetical protein